MSSAPRGVARRACEAFALAACLVLWPLRAGAQDTRDFRYAPRFELPLLGLGVAAWITSEALKPLFAPARCRWCEASPWEESVHERLRWSRPQAARRFSDAMLFGIVPAATLASMTALAWLHDDRRAGRMDAMVLGESLVLTAAFTQLTKFVAARQRPHPHAPLGDPPEAWGPDDHLSFFSGHTSSTFALAVAAGTIASLRGYREARWVWALGLPLAALTGYLRMAGERHYFSDVLVGALIGSACGALVPWLHARKRERM